MGSADSCFAAAAEDRQAGQEGTGHFDKVGRVRIKIYLNDYRVHWDVSFHLYAIIQS